ncbi:prostaglandin reductase 1-like [Zerene cesonia]|uniref:prostaglandin reductase 1-like n=1 Tax=Zerene cesonia TaxID=33412 RepID=UPI0018E58D81|nr:prostaglandin reductase 1-like [Zerene cesonia]
MVKARKYVVRKHFEGFPKRDDFHIVEYELPPLQSSEILIKTEWISVDPYQRAYNRKFPTPFDQFGFIVGTVEDSRKPRFQIGDKVVAHCSWCNYCIINPNEVNSKLDIVYKLPDLRGLSPSLGISAISAVGATAYFGFLEICHPKAGETVVVTGAAGAVGSIVGQIAKIKGCKVIGFAGTDDKVAWLQNELGFDKAYNYKTCNVNEVLKIAAPNGVDCFFDNVGGEMSSMIINHMNDFGRVSVCGSISAYNADVSQLPKAPILQLDIVMKQLKIEGFLAHRWLDRWPEAFEELINWILEGKIKIKEHITEGFDNVFEAFIGMLTGKNTGKAIVKI